MRAQRSVPSAPGVTTLFIALRLDAPLALGPCYENAMKRCEQCGAPVEQRTLAEGACVFCGVVLDEVRSSLVAHADLCADRSKGVLRTKSKHVQTTFDSTGLTGRSVEGAGPTVGMLACTDAFYTNVSVRVSCVLEPPQSEIQILLRHSAEGRYALRLADDGTVAIDRSMRGADGTNDFRFLAKGQIRNYAARWRDRQSTVVASVVGGTLALVVDGEEALRCHDEAIEKGRIAVGMLVVPDKPMQVTITRVEVRVIERRA